MKSFQQSKGNYTCLSIDTRLIDKPFSSYKMLAVNKMAKYLECNSVSVILDGEEYYFNKSKYNTHKQCYINQLPLNFDVICMIKDFLYYGSIETKKRYLQSQIDDQIYRMYIHREYKYDSEGNHIYSYQDTRIESTCIELYICCTCGNYKQNWQNSICPKVVCTCVVAPIYSAHVLDDDREHMSYYPDMGYDSEYGPPSDDDM